MTVTDSLCCSLNISSITSKEYSNFIQHFTPFVMCMHAHCTSCVHVICDFIIQLLGFLFAYQPPTAYHSQWQVNIIDYISRTSDFCWTCPNSREFRITDSWAWTEGCPLLRRTTVHNKLRECVKLVYLSAYKLLTVRKLGLEGSSEQLQD